MEEVSAGVLEAAKHDDTAVQSHHNDDVEEAWKTSPRNARNWSPLYKLVMTVVVSSIGFVCTMGSSIYAPGYEEVAATYHTSSTVAVLPIVTYNFGMAFGPLVASPVSESFGRRAVYLTVCPLFAIFVLGAGFSNNMASIIVCRFFAGLFASPSVAIAAATIADMFEPSGRAVPLISYYTTPWLGSLVGPLIGGFVVSGKTWRWTQWTTLFFTAALFWPILFTKESYKKTILQRDKNSEDKPSNPTLQHTIFQNVRTFIKRNLGRPIHMLVTEPVVGLSCVYMGFQFGLLYAFVVAIPFIFSTTYSFSLSSQGLAFLGLIIGCVLGSVILILVEKYIYQPKLRRHLAQNTSEDFPPEHRLYAAMLGSISLPTGLLIFAWTARPSIHFLVPIAATVLVMIGSLTVYVPAGMYMMETYGALYGASASGANSLLRYALAAIFPLFTLRMYEALGIGWATTLLAACTAAMAPIPWAFFRWGPGLRARSTYQRGD